MTEKGKSRRCLVHLACESKSRECVEYLIDEVMSARQTIFHNVVKNDDDADADAARNVVESRLIGRNTIQVDDLIEHSIPIEVINVEVSLPIKGNLLNHRILQSNWHCYFSTFGLVQILSFVTLKLRSLLVRSY